MAVPGAGASVTLASGSSWNVPTGVGGPLEVTVECVGGGAAGGAGISASGGGQGGGGGAYSRTTAIAVTRCLRGRYPELDLRIKWPNDFWIKRAKLGGILCEAVAQRENPFIVIGLGLNCAHTPEGLDQATTSLTEAALAPIQADEVRGPIIEELLKTLAELSAEGPAGLARDYDRWAVFERGSKVEWGANQQGVVQGLGEVGELLVVTDAGTVKLFAEDVRVRPL